VPSALQVLTQVEEMLISPVMLIISVYQLPQVSMATVGMLSTNRKMQQAFSAAFHVCLASLMF